MTLNGANQVADDANLLKKVSESTLLAVQCRLMQELARYEMSIELVKLERARRAKA